MLEIEIFLLALSDLMCENGIWCGLSSKKFFLSRSFEQYILRLKSIPVLVVMVLKPSRWLTILMQGVADSMAGWEAYTYQLSLWILLIHIPFYFNLVFVFSQMPLQYVERSFCFQMRLETYIACFSSLQSISSTLLYVWFNNFFIRAELLPKYTQHLNQLLDQCSLMILSINYSCQKYYFCVIVIVLLIKIKIIKNQFKYRKQKDLRVYQQVNLSDEQVECKAFP